MAMDSKSMKDILSSPYPTNGDLALSGSKSGYNPMKPLFSEVGDLQKTSDKLMFALISVKFPSQYEENL